MQAAVLQVDLVDRHVDAAQRTFNGVHVTGNPPLNLAACDRPASMRAGSCGDIRTGEVAPPTPKIRQRDGSQTPLANLQRFSEVGSL